MACRRGLRLRGWVGIALLALAALGAAAWSLWGDDVLEALLDPQIPYDVYRPPPPPDYRSPEAWALLPGTVHDDEGPADVFFVHPTTFDGGRDWNGPIGARDSARRLRAVMLPNYAGPFAAAGRVFAPRYR
jgi:hypothetical protein